MKQICIYARVVAAWALVGIDAPHQTVAPHVVIKSGIVSARPSDITELRKLVRDSIPWRCLKESNSSKHTFMKKRFND